MRERKFLMACGIMVAAACVWAQVVNENGCEFNHLYEWYTPETNKKFLRISDGGRTGKCLEVKITEGKGIGLTRSKRFPMELANDPIEISVWVKGKGTIQFQLNPKSAEDECIYDNTAGDFINVDSPDKWENISHTFNFTPKNVLLAKSTASYYLQFAIKPGSDLCLDDLKFREISGSMILMKQPSASTDAPTAPPSAETPKAEPVKGVVKEIVLSALKDIRLKTYADEKPLNSPPPGNAVQTIAEGVEL
jgi:hypothetical protein